MGPARTPEFTRPRAIPEIDFAALRHGCHVRNTVARRPFGKEPRRTPTCDQGRQLACARYRASRVAAWGTPFQAGGSQDAQRVREQWWAADASPSREPKRSNDAAARFVQLLREKRPAARSFSR
jgi:hypothetical protein